MRRLLLALLAATTLASAAPGLASAATSRDSDAAPRAVAAIAPAPVEPAHWLEEGEEEHGEEALGHTVIDGNDVVPGAAWAIVGILVGGLVLGVFYLLKRRVGGFPAHPAWVAPISIERSATFATEGTFGPADDSHGHGSSSHH